MLQKRIAPTPGDYLLISNAFSFVLTALITQKNKAISCINAEIAPAKVGTQSNFFIFQGY